MRAIKRLLISRPKRRDILDHWPQLIEEMRFSTQEFYQRVEVALRVREVPELKVTRVDFKEGGRLSPWREYLRCRRERLYFDICAMPFGTGFHVSKWCWQRPHRLGAVALVVALAIISGVAVVVTGPNNIVYFYLSRSYDLSSQQITLLLLGLPATLVVTVALWLGERLDETLLRVPLIGWIYERFIRRLTYYRDDRQSAYRAAVHAALCDVIDEICKSQGIAPLSDLARRPAHRELTAKTDGPGRAGGAREGGGNGGSKDGGGNKDSGRAALRPAVS